MKFGGGCAAQVLLAALLTTMACTASNAQHGHEGHGGQETPDEMGTVSNPALWSSVPKATRLAFEVDYDSLGGAETFQRYYDEIGPRAILEFLEQKHEACHSQAHPLGHLVFEKTGDLGEAVSVCGTACANACTHGVLRARFGGASLAEVRAEIPEICRSEDVAVLDRLGSCAHGVGHAAVIAAEYDLDAALRSCSDFGTKELDYYCATGIFMEYGATGPTPSDTVSTDFPCDENVRYASACYNYLSARIARRKSVGLPPQLATACMELTGHLRTACFHGVGKMNIARVRKRPSSIVEACLYGSSTDQEVCVEGAVETVAHHDRDKAFQICPFLDGRNREVCLDVAERGFYRIPRANMDLYLPDK